MKMFGNISSDGLEETQDRLGGVTLLDTGVYNAKVTMAYAGQSGAAGSKSQSVTVHLDVGGQEFRETFWITNRNGENYYQDKQDASKKHPLPGYAIVDDLCLCATGYDLSDQDVDEKVIKIWDFDARAEVPKNMPVLVDLIGKEVIVAIVKQTVDKQKKNETTGNYQNTGETRDENILDKVFHAETSRTVAEIRAGIEEAIFMTKWADKNTGKTRNRSKGVTGTGGQTGAPGRPGGKAAGSGAQKPKSSLFGA